MPTFQNSWVYPVIEWRVVDGDTIDVLCDQGLRSYQRERFRLAQMDAWEIRRPTLEAGRAAKNRLIELCEKSDALRVRTFKDKKDRERKGKFGRYIAKLQGRIHGRWVDLGELLVDEGHAVFEDYD